MTEKQIVGLAGAVGGFVALAIFFHFAPRLFVGVPMPQDTPGDRLAFAARWLILPGMMLLIGVWAAARRGIFADAIDGTRTPANYGLEINLRYNQNTVEQIILAAIAWAGLAVTLPVSSLYLIPAMASAFVMGRATFWIGYLIYPMARAFGMAVTMVPTIGAYGWLVWQGLTRR